MNLRDHHIFCWFEINFYNYCTINFLLGTRGGVLPTHPAGLIEHVRDNPSQIRADEYLKRCGLIVPNQLKYSEKTEKLTYY